MSFEKKPVSFWKLRWIPLLICPFGNDHILADVDFNFRSTRSLTLTMAAVLPPIFASSPAAPSRHNQQVEPGHQDENIVSSSAFLAFPPFPFCPSGANFSPYCDWNPSGVWLALRVKNVDTNRSVSSIDLDENQQVIPRRTWDSFSQAR